MSAPRSGPRSGPRRAEATDRERYVMSVAVTRLVVRPTARDELRVAVEYHEIQRADLGRRLEQAVQDAFDLILRRPRMYAVEHGDIRLAPVDGFSYVVCYRARPGAVVVVVAVYHTSRDPAGWQGRT